MRLPENDLSLSYISSSAAPCSLPFVFLSLSPSVHLTGHPLFSSLYFPDLNSFTFLYTQALYLSALAPPSLCSWLLLSVHLLHRILLSVDSFLVLCLFSSLHAHLAIKFYLCMFYLSFIGQEQCTTHVLLLIPEANVHI